MVPSRYAPRTGGADDSHHRTAGIAGRTRRRGGGVAARGARTAGRTRAADRRTHEFQQDRLTAFVQGLQELGWTVGRNLQMDYRWGAGNIERYRIFAAELVALTPDILVTVGAPAVEALQRATRTVPIVFTSVTDPVGGGLVASLARPGGNTTGFTLSEYGLSGKWLELLKEIAPRVMRTAVLRDPVAVGSANSPPSKPLRRHCRWN